MLGNSTFKPIPNSSWIKNITQQKRLEQKCIGQTYSLKRKKNFTDNINSSGSPDLDWKKKNNNSSFYSTWTTRKYTLLKNGNRKFFLAATEKRIHDLLQKNRHFDPVNRQLKSRHKYKTKPVKADTTNLGNKTLLKWFRKFINTSTNENTDVLEYQISELKAPCLPFSMILEEFHF